MFCLQLILCDRTTWTFLADTGKKILSSIIVKAQKVKLKMEITDLENTNRIEIEIIFLNCMSCSPPHMLLFGFQSPKRFEEVFEEMISFLEHTEHWENTELELAARGVSVIL